MENRIIQYFTEGLELARNEFYLDATHKFNMLVEEFPESDLADDALYNVGLCYFKMKQFEIAIETFQQVIYNYPDATISVLDNEFEFGKIVAKCYYSIVLSYLALGKIDLAVEVTSQLNQFSDNTYVVLNDEKKTYSELAANALKTY